LSGRNDKLKLIGHQTGPLPPPARAELRDFDYHYGFYGSEEHKGLRLIVSIAITQRNVVVGYLDYMTLVDATGHTLDIYDLTFVAAKQIFRMLSFHFKPQPIKRLEQPPLPCALYFRTLPRTIERRKSDTDRDLAA
jgi:hypothetical protein